ncbi:MAG: proliferating cell nuclear antigen (pcna) [Candidatus Micrarchaeota archaeon]|nr:proliferating cell nuclear antigen (pcna) [Candidatus Micrarchaeota archaeon]MDE1848051.1 proliferating cell nuclear antigen (pcna) [Candidatus Micrarchaeota archaeon]MDE1864718.1 proliferating cell nuclear antigen (pcna) [Candidatus Micrarchaeota archaeon]
MFELKIDNAKYWRDCVEAIVNLVDEGSFNIAKDGITLKAMDPSGISMVSFFMPSKAFGKFNVEKPASIGLNLDNLSKVLSRTRDNEELSIKEHEGKLSLEFIGTGSRRRYRLPLIDVRKNVEKEPNVDFDVSAEVLGEPLKDVIKDASLISSYIAFKAAKEQMMISARGDSGELEETHEVDGNIIRKLSAKANADAVFNLEYLENIIKACPVGSQISLSLKSNEPLKLSYNIGDAVLTYYLAPYMES